MGAFEGLTAQFDRVNQKRKGDQFELVCKWFLKEAIAIPEEPFTLSDCLSAARPAL